MQNAKSLRRRIWTLTLMCAMLISAGMFAPNTDVARAASSANVGADTAFAPVEITRGLVIDCARTLSTSKGRQTAAQRGICTNPKGVVQPLDSSTVRGDCGWITLSMRNLGGGRIVIGESFTSTAGIMDWIDWDIFWNNTDTGAASTYDNWAIPLDVSYYTEQQITSGAGYIFGAMLNTYVLLDNATVCRGLNPQTQVRAT